MARFAKDCGCRRANWSRGDNTNRLKSPAGSFEFASLRSHKRDSPDSRTTDAFYNTDTLASASSLLKSNHIKMFVAILSAET
jgi:hypothetical protein